MGVTLQYGCSSVTLTAMNQWVLAYERHHTNNKYEKKKKIEIKSRRAIINLVLSDGEKRETTEYGWMNIESEKK